MNGKSAVLMWNQGGEMHAVYISISYAAPSLCLKKSTTKTNKQKEQYGALSDLSSNISAWIHRVTGKAKGCDWVRSSTIAESSTRADIKGIMFRHLEKPLIQFEKYFSQSDNSFCDAGWIQFPFRWQCNREVMKSSDSAGSADWIICSDCSKKSRHDPALCVVRRWIVCTAVTSDIKSNKVTLLFTSVWICGCELSTLVHGEHKCNRRRKGCVHFRMLRFPTGRREKVF